MPAAIIITTKHQPISQGDQLQRHQPTSQGGLLLRPQPASQEEPLHHHQQVNQRDPQQNHLLLHHPSQAQHVRPGVEEAEGDKSTTPYSLRAIVNRNRKS